MAKEAKRRFHDLTAADNDGVMDLTADADESGNAWACAVCTFHNAPAADACSMCGAPNPSPATDPLAQFIAFTGADKPTAQAFVTKAAARGFSVEQAVSYYHDRRNQLPPSAPNVAVAAPPVPPSFGGADAGYRGSVRFSAAPRRAAPAAAAPAAAAPPAAAPTVAAPAPAPARGRGKGKGKATSKAKAKDGHGSTTLTSAEMFHLFQRSVAAAKAGQDSGGAAAAAQVQAELKEVVQRLYEHVLAENDEAQASMGGAAAAGRGHASGGSAATMRSSGAAATECSICFCDLGGSAAMVAAAAADGAPSSLYVVAGSCGHDTTCAACLGRWLRAKLDENAVPPWPRCPHLDCKADLCPAALLAACAAAPPASPASSPSAPPMLAMLPHVYLHRQLQRFPEWLPCASCEAAAQAAGGGGGGGGSGGGGGGGKAEVVAPLLAGGFLVGTPGYEEGRSARCCSCGTSVARLAPPVRDDADDEALQKMLAEGTMRDCPQCRTHTFKEKGVCNVINCTTCNCWWNWRSYEVGRSSAELKQRARMNGTLWEPGELAYQQNLQRSDPAAFKSLLERNGVAYNPNYVRGS